MFPNGPLHTHIHLSAVQAEFQREIDISKDELHTHLSAVQAEFQHEIGTLKDELHTHLSAVQAEFQREIGKLKDKLQNLKDLNISSNCGRIQLGQVKFLLGEIG